MGSEPLEYHPVSEIKAETSDSLLGRKVVLGVTSSAAIYRAVDLARELIRLGADVLVIMSGEATRYVSPELFEWATGARPCIEFTGRTEHISLAHDYDALVIAPATANTLNKIASGVADTSVTLTALTFIGSGKPVMVVPAMHKALWDAKPTQEGIRKLASMGITVFPPQIKEGKVKFPDVSDIALATDALINRGKDLKGLKLLVTAGPTREFIDRVRFISNPSSGLMGVSIAKEAFFRGAYVELIHGPLSVEVPYFIPSEGVVSTEEMLEAVANSLRKEEFNAAILAAAPSDFRPEAREPGKLPSGRDIDLKLIPTPKISLEVRKFFRGLLVGFAAEVVEGDLKLLEKKATEKLRERGFDIIVANDVSRSGVGFSSKYNEVVIVSKDGDVRYLRRKPKYLIAREILDYIKERIK